MLRRNVLIFHSGALGDFIMSWPLVLAAGRVFAQSRIICVTGGQKGRLAERLLRVESTDIEAGWHRLFSDPRELPEPARKMLAGAHSVLSFVSTPTDAWTAGVRQLAPQAEVLCLQPTPPADFHDHASRFLLQQLSGHAILYPAVEQMLRSIADRGVVQRPARGQGIIIHPGSGSREKCWPLAKFIELADRLKQDGQSVEWMVGEVERDRWPAGDITRLRSIALVHEPPTFVNLAEQISQSRLFIGNDSGPGHLVGVMGIPTLSLFGPTDPAVWQPLGPRVRALRQVPLDRLEVDQVHALAGELLK